MIKHSFHFVNNIETHLITIGDPFNCNGNDVILCVTGNPGIPDFYEEFISTINKNTGLPVCLVGQCGHEEVSHKSSNILQQQHHLFNLDGQINHKLDLINNLIDKKSHLHLIGHSIGSWMIIELLNLHSDLIKRSKSINLLFPTVQHMAETNNGLFLNKYIRNLHFLIMFFVTLFYMLPDCIHTFLINIYLKYNSLPEHYVGRLRKYLNPLVIEKVLFLAYDELDSVIDLNVQGLNKIKKITNVIYSVRDGWAPVGYMDDFKQFQPDLTMEAVDVNHAFVLKSSERIAEKVSNNINSKLPSLHKIR